MHGSPAVGLKRSSRFAEWVTLFFFLFFHTSTVYEINFGVIAVICRIISFVWDPIATVPSFGTQNTFLVVYSSIVSHHSQGYHGLKYLKLLQVAWYYNYLFVFPFLCKTSLDLPVVIGHRLSSSVLSSIIWGDTDREKWLLLLPVDDWRCVGMTVI